MSTPLRCVLVGVMIGLASVSPARADPSSFGSLGCRCNAPNETTSVQDDIQRGIRSGLHYPLDRATQQQNRPGDG